MSQSSIQASMTKPGGHQRVVWMALAVILVLTLVRIVVLANSFITLGGDEAQYWAWSRKLAFGYFTKPPMIAWLIAGTTAICGNGEACIRLSSPLLHAGSAMLVFYLAKRLYGYRVALWSAITYATLPIVWFSSGLMTTDVPLIFCWTGALLCLDKLIAARRESRASDALRLAALTGALIGLGLLSKYAMIYFVICTVIFMILSADARRALLSPAGLVVIGVAAAIFAPNLVWNASTGFATFGHTAANANWGAQILNPQKLAEFLLSQIGLFGPVLAIMFLFGLMTLGRRLQGEYQRNDLFLLCFSAPILVIMLVQSFVSRANANWAAPAYVAITILTIAWFLRGPGLVLLGRFRFTGQIFVNGSLLMHLVTGTVLYAFITVPGAIEFFGMENSFKRVRGWDVLAARLETITSRKPYKAIVADNRLVTAELIYYGRGTKLPIVIFDVDGRPANEFELNRAYAPDLGEPVLFVTPFPNSKVPESFGLVEPVEVFRMEQGGSRHTDFHLYHMAAFKPQIAGRQP